MEPQPSHDQQDKFKLYCVGSAELNQFYIPYNEDKLRASKTRKPLCLSDIKQFLLIDEDTEEKKETIVPNPLLAEKIVGVACGGTHTIINTASGKVFSWGSNDEGALGREGNETIPLQVELQAPIDMISAGDAHSIFASCSNGMFYFAGAYKGIQKGFLSETVKKPELFTLDSLFVKQKKDPGTIRKIVSGSNHTLLLVGETVFIRGDSEYFASGRKILERHKERYDPIKFQCMGIKHATDIFTGGMHCFVKTKDLVYYGWGNNAFGQLGIGNREHQKLATEITFFREMNLTKIVGGEHHSIFLTAEGEVYACGRNDNGQLGLGEDLEEDHTPPLRKSRRSTKPSPDKNRMEEESKSQEPKSKEPTQQLFDKDNLGELLNINFIWEPRKLEIQNIENIAAGTHFSYAVANEKSANKMYSWGLASNYVLINGSEENDKYTPYEVLPKIINNEIVKGVSAGAQHLVYLATPNRTLEIKLDESLFSKHVIAKKGKIIGKLH